MSTVTLPTYSDTVDQRFFIEPLGGPRHPRSYLDRFPEEIYDKSPDSHLVRLLYTLIGPSGVNSLKRNVFEARLELEAHGIELFDLEKFYGNPFAFGRILDEVHEHDLTGILTPEEWDVIRAKDEKYRSRAIDFMNGLRAGNSPKGMHLIARAGLGHEVEIIENYKYLFDQHSDDPLGLVHFGQTLSTEEFVVVPRREVSRTEEQQIHVDGFPDGGTFYLGYQGAYTGPISYNANYLSVEVALQAVGTIGAGNVQVTGGPFPNPFKVIFRADLADRNVQQLTTISALVDVGALGNPTPQVYIETVNAGKESSDEVVRISERDQHSLQTALDRLRPVPTIPTVNTGAGTSTRQRWQSVTASSQYHEARTFVSGDPQVEWPPPKVDNPFWVTPDVEKPAPVPRKTPGRHYINFHKVATATAYTDTAILDENYLADIATTEFHQSEHIGTFSKAQKMAFPLLSTYTNDTEIFDAIAALRDDPQVVSQTGIWRSGDKYYPFFNRHYPSWYLRYLHRKTPTRRADFWASLERPSGSDFIEIDIGAPRFVNFITLDISRKPVDIEISVDGIDQTPERKFQPVYPMDTRMPTSVTSTYEFNPWQPLTFYFQNRAGHIPLTRYVRIRLKRRTTGAAPLPGGESFLFNNITKVQEPYSVDLRNIRIGRNVQPAPGTQFAGNYRHFRWWGHDYDYYRRNYNDYYDDTIHDYYYNETAAGILR